QILLNCAHPCRKAPDLLQVVIDGLSSLDIPRQRCGRLLTGVDGICGHTKTNLEIVDQFAHLDASPQRGLDMVPEVTEVGSHLPAGFEKRSPRFGVLLKSPLDGRVEPVEVGLEPVCDCYHGVVLARLLLSLLVPVGRTGLEPVTKGLCLPLRLSPPGV